MRRLPNSLSLRLFLIIIGGVLLAVALTATLAQRDRVHAIGEFRLHAAIGHLADVVTLLAQVPAAARRDIVEALPREEWRIDFSPLTPDARVTRLPELAWILRKKLGRLAKVEAAWLENPSSCPPHARRCGPIPRTAVVKVRFADDQLVWLGYKRVRDRPPPHEQQAFLWSIAIFVASLAAAAWWAVRLALRPLSRMAQAAEAFGRDIGHPPMDENGPVEVRRAAESFNAMQERIRTYMTERTQILAAVAHDLKTPLTRMQLRLENCADDGLKGKLRDDIVAMHTLVEEGLDLARSLETTEAIQPVDLDALLQSLTDDATEAGQDVAYGNAAGSELLVFGRTNALRRVFTNLFDNAVKYGRQARVVADRSEAAVRVCIRDRGPGIADDRLQEVLLPFVRLESSRSRDTGGTGLGLAIAANLLKSQHGRLTLRNHPEGGLEAVVDLPRIRVGTIQSSGQAGGPA
jgi:signal transduction histidine kinase